MTSVQDLRRRLIALGFPLPKYRPDGGMGLETLAAMDEALNVLWRPEPVLKRTQRRLIHSGDEGADGATFPPPVEIARVIPSANVRTAGGD